MGVGVERRRHRLYSVLLQLPLPRRQRSLSSRGDETVLKESRLRGKRRLLEAAAAAARRRRRRGTGSAKMRVCGVAATLRQETK